MVRLPFGVSRFDTICGGGAPAGSVVLLTGDPGAGAREFLATATVVNGLAHTDPQRFERTYGPMAETARKPDEIHYLSLTTSEAALVREWREAFDQEMVGAAREAVSIRDLSARYFLDTRVPTAWFADAPAADELNQPAGEQDLLGTVTDYIAAHAAGNLVALDSLTALCLSRAGSATWLEIPALLRGFRHAAADWGGLILLLLDEASVPRKIMAQITSGVDARFRFEWAAGGHAIDRTMVLEKFRGVLPSIDDDDIVRFETGVDDSGFELSDVRKIR